MSPPTLMSRSILPTTKNVCPCIGPSQDIPEPAVYARYSANRVTNRTTPPSTSAIARRWPTVRNGRPYARPPRLCGRSRSRSICALPRALLGFIGVFCRERGLLGDGDHGKEEAPCITSCHLEQLAEELGISLRSSADLGQRGAPL